MLGVSVVAWSALLLAELGLLRLGLVAFVLAVAVVRTALSWLRANAARFGLDPNFHRHADIHMHGRVTMGPPLVSALTNRPLRGGLAMTGEFTLTGHLLPVGGSTS